MKRWRWAVGPLFLAAAVVTAANEPKEPGKEKKGPPDGTGQLFAPVRLEVAGKPIDTEIGHAAPFVGDIDGDGARDLLVGQFGDGILWVFKNTGTDAGPKLAAGAKFKDGAEDGRVPTG
jgi:hypothetical protein